MSPDRRIDHETLRRSSRALLYGAIIRGGEASRIDLAKKAGLSPATVGAIVEDLMAEGILRELRVGESTGGRRPVLVGLRPEGRTALVGSVGVRGVFLSLVDLGGRIVAEASVAGLPRGNALAERMVRKAVAELLAKPGAADGQALERAEEPGLGAADGASLPGGPGGRPQTLAGCAIDVPGMVRASDGTVLYSPPLELRSFDLSSIVSDAAGAPALVFKDTDALLIAERRRGAAKSADNAVYVWVKAGVGLSYLHDGELLVLPKGGFELGHTASIKGGVPCHCGNSGCIGTELSEAHAVGLYRGASGGGEAGGYDELCRLAGSGDEAALSVLLSQAQDLGATLSNVVNLLNPSLIIIGGPLWAAPRAVHERVRSSLRERALAPFKAEAEIAFSDLSRGEIHAAMGEELFSRILFPA